MWSSAEVHFAQRLASNEKKTRDKAVKKLKKYLQAKSSAKRDGGFSEDDLLKIWKGLHYCMWMQDKPIIQEELADTISSLLHIFPHVPTQFQFLKVFFQTEAREWNGIDRWRLDKFMMLIRRMLREAFQMLKRLKFVDEHVNRFNSLLFDSLLSPPSSLVPDGLKIHLIDIYLEELVRIGIDNLNSEQAVNFLQPFLTFMQKADNIVLVNRVISHLLNDIQNEAEAKSLKQKYADDNEKDEEDRSTLQFDLKILANKLYELGSSKECLERNRSCIYACVRRFQDLHDGVAQKREKKTETETDISKEDINKAVRRLVTMEKNSQRKKKKKKEKKDNKGSEGGEDTKENVLQLIVEESAKSDSHDLESSDAQEKKRKKNKRKMDHCKTDEDAQTEPKSKLKKKTSFERVCDQSGKDTAKESNDIDNNSITTFQHQDPSLASEDSSESPFEKAQNTNRKLKTVMNVANISHNTTKNKAGKIVESSAIQSLKAVKDMRSKVRPTEDGNSSSNWDEDSPSPSKKQKKDCPVLRENSSTSLNDQAKKELKTGTTSKKDSRKCRGKKSPKQHDVNVDSKLSNTADINCVDTNKNVTILKSTPVSSSVDVTVLKSTPVSSSIDVTKLKSTPVSSSIDVTKLKSTPVSRGIDVPLEKGEIEIYVPNKKFKGNLKGTPLFKGGSADSEEKKTPMSAFARFEKANIPIAYVQKALFKKFAAKQAKVIKRV
ncbi:hypothetical protein CHS0354_040449 [Potamilus streckersoni]|uniref:Uncharacterized protein n=1 Tax=Potamilus streckersoni TaxID=2493646 RepID=A0AAE0T0Z2_9BIVA|nr:hypothetical protein CHS0354_040449 [Potamilus streckersoni]